MDGVGCIATNLSTLGSMLKISDHTEAKSTK
ncbi:hypothetical protein T12_7050 [Trichinella patagoniensis]|uniref:Uncharacterized protein n=1 Tax=Trichinella patagoniensis TaxID=990121 RepID=A0A0V0XDH1_9BILA|nr:hypothetical protein T12_7050 [Trichinella patagoniensis]